MKKRKLIYILIMACFFSATVYFSVHVITGSRGLITLIKLHNKINKQKVVLQEALKLKSKLENKTLLLREENLDLDLLDEQVRSILGYADSTEAIILVD